MTRLILITLGTILAGCSTTPQAPPPNIVIIFADDLGYGDLSSYGNPTIRTPHLDRMAGDGIKLTQFYVASPVCSPSRAALLTGCYPKRVGMHKHVIFPQYDYGLHPDEITIADLLSERGYATACFGKWHLGHRPGLLPLDQGFDEFLGVPYSNDMSTFHRKPDDTYPHRLPLMRGNDVVQWEPDQHLLTKMYTDAAVEFIERNHDRPFFVYLPHTMPHIPIYASEAFEGRSPRGLYGDVIEEIDWSVGEIRNALERYGIADNTLVIFTSDNGPWLQFKARGGSAGPLRGGKGTNWEGGQREPFIACWAGHIPPGAIGTEVVTAMDILPTVAALTGDEWSDHRQIDGRNMLSVLLAESDDRSRDDDHFLYYTSRGELAGIRRGPWKLLLQANELYHVERDISEKWNVAEANAELVDELRNIAERHDAEITRNARPVLQVDTPAWDLPADHSN